MPNHKAARLQLPGALSGLVMTLPI